MFGNITRKIDLTCLHIVNQCIDVRVVVLRKQIFAIHQVSLQLWVLDVQHISIELLKLIVGHPLRIQLKIVSENDLQFFGANMATTVDNLLPVRVDILRFGTVGVPVLTEHFRDLLARLVINPIMSSVRIRVIVPLRDHSVAEVDLYLGAL